MMSITENCMSNCWEPREKESSVGLVVATNRLNAVEPSANFEPWTNPSYVVPPNPNATQYCGDQGPFFPIESNLSKQGCSPMKDLGICDGDDLCEGFNMDDMGLNFENSDNSQIPFQGCRNGLPIYAEKPIGY
ncbi:hypothetical protein HHK36_005570 [Tetracentron sinense]|uniref:Uncharacterized protein n=1 Tax=Tetracentron sinense TaxID=13715 RepID=A0A834ZL88_TETSI|nr:hypothetical protein HHK36_005570 [Tetracentron sinense]